MTSWYELETQFLDLAFRGAEVGLGLRAELEPGSDKGGEGWYLDGSSPSVRQEFVELCRRAGQCLFDVHLSDHETGSAVEPHIRWYRLLKERNKSAIQSSARLSEAGKAAPVWSMDALAARSASLCKELDSSISDQKQTNWFVKQIEQNAPKAIFTTLCSLCTLLILGYLLYKNG